jgi:hypothetical protein
MRRKRKQQDFQAEVEAHLQLEADELRSDGLAPADAQAAARRAFGNRTAAEERFYESGRWMFWDHLLRDVRFAARLLIKDAPFTGLAILGLALGIGVSTAIVAVMHGMILQVSAEYQDPSSYVGLGRAGNQFSYAEYRYTPITRYPFAVSTSIRPGRAWFWVRFPVGRRGLRRTMSMPASPRRTSFRRGPWRLHWAGALPRKKRPRDRR